MTEDSGDYSGDIQIKLEAKTDAAHADGRNNNGVNVTVKTSILLNEGTRTDYTSGNLSSVNVEEEAAGTTDAISAAAALSALDSELRKAMDRPLLISQRLMQTKRSLDAIDRALSSVHKQAVVCVAAERAQSDALAALAASLESFSLAGGFGGGGADARRKCRPIRHHNSDTTCANGFGEQC